MKTISTKNQILDTLQWSSDYYDARYFQSYFNYCTIHGKYPSKIQQLMANSKVSRWFAMEYEKAEQLLLKIAEAIPPTKVEFLRGQYKALTAEIMGLYPKPLIENIKRNREFSTVYFDKIVTFSN